MGKQNHCIKAHILNTIYIRTSHLEAAIVNSHLIGAIVAKRKEKICIKMCIFFVSLSKLNDCEKRTKENEGKKIKHSCTISQWFDGFSLTDFLSVVGKQQFCNECNRYPYFFLLLIAKKIVAFFQFHFISFHFYHSKLFLLRGNFV